MKCNYCKGEKVTLIYNGSEMIVNINGVKILKNGLVQPVYYCPICGREL